MFRVFNKNVIELNKLIRFNSFNKIDKEFKKIEENRKKFIEELNLNNRKYFKNKGKSNCR